MQRKTISTQNDELSKFQNGDGWKQNLCTSTLNYRLTIIWNYGFKKQRYFFKYKFEKYFGKEKQ